LNRITHLPDTTQQSVVDGALLSCGTLHIDQFSYGPGTNA